LASQWFWRRVRFLKNLQATLSNAFHGRILKSAPSLIRCRENVSQESTERPTQTKITVKNNFETVGTSVVLASTAAMSALAAEISTNALADSTAPRVSNGTLPAPEKPADAPAQNWNFHVQNTDIVQGYPGFSSQYSGPNSLPNGGESRETVSLDLMAGVRLWRGAEAHIDGVMWQGFGLNNTLGVEGFPNGEAFRLGTSVPNGTISRLFTRQTIGLGGE
jgi:hypothetical protein